MANRAILREYIRPIHRRGGAYRNLARFGLGGDGAGYQSRENQNLRPFNPLHAGMVAPLDGGGNGSLGAGSGPERQVTVWNRILSEAHCAICWRFQQENVDRQPVHVARVPSCCPESGVQSVGCGASGQSCWWLCSAFRRSHRQCLRRIRTPSFHPAAGATESITAP